MCEGDPETAWRCTTLNAVVLCVLCASAGSDYALFIPLVDSVRCGALETVARMFHGERPIQLGRNTSYAPNAPAKLRRPLKPVEIVSVPSRPRTRFPHVHRPPTWPALGADDFHMLVQCPFVVSDTPSLLARVVLLSGLILAPSILRDYLLEIAIPSLGAMSKIPGLRELCALAALILACDAFAMFTFFVAVLRMIGIINAPEPLRIETSTRRSPTRSSEKAPAKRDVSVVADRKSTLARLKLLLISSFLTLLILKLVTTLTPAAALSRSNRSTTPTRTRKVDITSPTLAPVLDAIVATRPAGAGDILVRVSRPSPFALSQLRRGLRPQRQHQGRCPPSRNIIGYMPIPLGIAGPLKIDGVLYPIPKGTLVASTSRGCKALNAGGGVTTVLTTA
ncbi:hypothetical protein EXIGLDRAFT_772759 [Exidia glandulosa HHB12029]|uniref:SSD domain-containing protein n=1 Tax=Exidia glandulosa HHB12029 TaxID=1314781 RepID=A0A165F4W9_EXIGL|nr:hypothetical protein EXIGLDRAFT_772759 [Exidia glandulosa HHB12029]